MKVGMGLSAAGLAVQMGANLLPKDFT